MRQKLKGACGVLLVDCSVALCASADCPCFTGMRGYQREQSISERGTEEATERCQCDRNGKVHVEFCWFTVVSHCVHPLIVCAAQGGEEIKGIKVSAREEATERYQLQ